jgi:hypothetical protein
MTEILPEVTDALREELTDSRSQFTAEDKIAVVMAYLITGGNSTKAADLSAVHEMKPATIRQWKKRSKWWANAEAFAKSLLQKDLDRAYTKMLHRTEQEIFDRVENGDVVMLKDGTQVRKPLGGKDLMYIHGIMHDKRAMLRGEPTSRTEKINPMEVVHELAKVLQEQGEASKKEAVAQAPWKGIPEDELTGQRKTH